MIHAPGPALPASSRLQEWMMTAKTRIAAGSIPLAVNVLPDRAPESLAVAYSPDRRRATWHRKSAAFGEDRENIGLAHRQSEVSIDSATDYFTADGPVEAPPAAPGWHTTRNRASRFAVPYDWQCFKTPEKIVSCCQWPSVAFQRVLTGVSQKTRKRRGDSGVFVDRTPLLTTTDSN